MKLIESEPKTSASSIKSSESLLARADFATAWGTINANLAKRDLRHFVRAAWAMIEPKAFVSGWHIDVMCEHLVAVTRGEILRLIINVPPRHMKSLLVSVFWPAWVWITQPSMRWLFISYAEHLSIRDNVRSRRIIESPWYQQYYKDAFKLTTDQNTKTRYENNRNGYRIATAIEGSITGDGGDIVVLDDPNNVKKVESPKVRESTNDTWDTAISNRLNDPKTGAFVIIQHRTNERDMTGHVLTKEESGWTHLCLPARYEPDHPHVYRTDRRRKPGAYLWPKQYGRKELAELEENMGTYGTAGQLQQRPAPRTGGMFERDWWNIVNAVPVHADAKLVRAWDFAATEEKRGTDPDWTAHVLMLMMPDKSIYILHADRMRVSPGKVEKALLATASQDRAKHGDRVTVRIPQDPGQAGKFQARYFARKLSGHRVKIMLETGSKVTRAEPFASQCEAGNVYLLKGSWNDPFIDEFALFPRGAHDDRVDATSGAYEVLVSRKEAFFF